MADSVPAALRQADVNIWKCATKAAQLRTVKPIMAYWCDYWAVNQILAKQLHTSDQDILAYTTASVEKLEQTKSDYANEDAVTDDAAGQAYVEQFAQETLDRAERAVRANRVTQQTATTFDAAATFFHVANIWGPVDRETQQKIKYAKWNAARIIKAIKEGKDPNESNPKHEQPAPVELDPHDPAVQSLGGAPSTTISRRATVEDVPDVDLARDAAGVSLPQNPVSAGPSPVSDGGLQLPGVPTDLGQPAEPGHFPSEPTLPPPPQQLNQFQAPPDFPPPPTGWTPSQPSPTTSSPPASWSHTAANPPPGPGFHHQPPAPPTAPSTFSTNAPPTAAVASPPVNPPTDTPGINMAPTATTAGPTASPPLSGTFTTNEAAMVEAQKHAKWAISALNFEDVPTAVRELRRALDLLQNTR
ncbi:9aa4dbfc-c348-4341-8ade-b453861e1da3 [Thermothielavioides terrestris]|uniref:9aa4dbfc-c348-4341-8ade-b453861e1da3 n=1 Tax=Thermothielavioides terrestris TaxID=2587410 RepID=A0A446B7F9_9PEZI|nr:9aa4dbfc-c348-4341-8ade-b453861e1da3 [Thermothielavioides terrestris]